MLCIFKKNVYKILVGREGCDTEDISTANIMNSIFYPQSKLSFHTRYICSGVSKGRQSIKVSFNLVNAGDRSL